MKYVNLKIQNILLISLSIMIIQLIEITTLNLILKINYSIGLIKIYNIINKVMNPVIKIKNHNYNQVL